MAFGSQTFSESQMKMHLVTCGTVTLNSHLRWGKDCLGLGGGRVPSANVIPRVCGASEGVAGGGLPVSRSGETAPGAAGSARLMLAPASCPGDVSSGFIPGPRVRPRASGSPFLLQAQGTVSWP